MTWSEEHDVLFCRELIVTQPFQYKAGSREKGQCWDSIACKLNGIAKPFFKVDQRSLRDHLNKLLKEYARKKAYEEKASGIDPEVTELDTLLEEVSELLEESRNNNATTSENKAKNLQEERKSADAIRRRSMQRLGEMRKSESSDDLEDAVTPKRRKNNGSDTVNYLREKSSTEMEIRKEELALKKEELAFQIQRDQKSNDRCEQMIQQNQRQAEALLLLMAKLAEKI